MRDRIPARYECLGNCPFPFYYLSHSSLFFWVQIIFPPEISLIRSLVPRVRAGSGFVLSENNWTDTEPRCFAIVVSQGAHRRLRLAGAATQRKEVLGNSDLGYSHVAFVIQANLFAPAASSISPYKRRGRADTQIAFPHAVA